MKQRHPSREECLLLLQEYHTPDHVVRHCLAVTDAALKLGKALIEKGFSLDLSLIESAGLIHDIARVEDNHWDIGADFALAHGYQEEAEIIRAHMNHSFHPDPTALKELDLVCLGDRLILEDQYVGIDARMQYVIDKFQNKPDIAAFIQGKKEISKQLIQNIECILGRSVEEIIKETDLPKPICE